MNWKPNAAGDLETIHNGNRYRAEESYGLYWLYRKPLELSSESECLGYGTLEDCETYILDAPSATITQ